MVTLTGLVGYGDASPTGESGLRNFELKTSVYDGASRKTVEFSVYCFFSDGNRFQKTPTPAFDSFVNLTGKVAGRVIKKNCLAVRILDISYLQSIQKSPSGSTESTPTKRAKQWSHWNRGADSTTPSKKIRYSIIDEDTPTTPTPSGPSSQIHEPESEQQISAAISDSGDVGSSHRSPVLTSVERDGSPPIDSPSAQLFNREERPLRNRRSITKKL